MQILKPTGTRLLVEAITDTDLKSDFILLPEQRAQRFDEMQKSRVLAVGAKTGGHVEVGDVILHNVHMGLIIPGADKKQFLLDIRDVVAKEI